MQQQTTSLEKTELSTQELVALVAAVADLLGLPVEHAQRAHDLQLWVDSPPSHKIIGYLVRHPGIRSNDFISDERTVNGWYRLGAKVTPLMAAYIPMVCYACQGAGVLTTTDTDHNGNNVEIRCTECGEDKKN